MSRTTRTLAWMAVDLVVAGILAGCTSGPSETPASRSSVPQTQHSPRQTPRGMTVECPVTVPSPAVIPGVAADHLFGSDNSYGNGKLWVGGLGDAGVIRADPSFVARDGSVGWKMGWWRKVPGRLGISGRRLDAPAPRIRADVPRGYGRTGFQSSGCPSDGRLLEGDRTSRHDGPDVRDVRRQDVESKAVILAADEPPRCQARHRRVRIATLGCASP
jgi:hypothetical protein